MRKSYLHDLGFSIDEIQNTSSHSIMKSITFKKYIWVHGILSFASLYSLILKYEIKDLYYKDTYRLTNSDRLTFIPIFMFLSFATTWLYYYLSKNKARMIKVKDHRQIMVYWFQLIIANFVISINFFTVFFKPFSISGVLEYLTVVGNIFVFYSIYNYANKSIKKT